MAAGAGARRIVERTLRPDPKIRRHRITNAGEGAEPIEILAAVARAVRVPPRLASIAQGGLGLKIRAAPNAYYDFVSEFFSDQAAPAPPKAGPSPEPEPPKPKFKVHAQLTGSPRSRTLTIDADSLEQAKTVAARQLGEGWTVTDAERV